MAKVVFDGRGMKKLNRFRHQPPPDMVAIDWGKTDHHTTPCILTNANENHISTTRVTSFWQSFRSEPTPTSTQVKQLSPSVGRAIGKKEKHEEGK